MHTIELDPIKVLRQFGPHPELGKAMPCLPKKHVQAGFRWVSVFGKLKPSRYELDVPRRVALQHVSGKLWRVICDEPYWPAVQAWLFANCRGQQEKRRKSKRYSPKIRR
jgi:hypothetical protein